VSSLPVNIVDLIVIAVLLLSALLALFRGFVKEILSILGWIIALAVTYFAFPVARDIARSYIESGIFADIAAGAGLFLPTLILCSLATHWVSEQVRASAVSAIDRSLGFLFGLARGAVIVVVAWWVVDHLIPEPTQPAWLQQARTHDLAKAGYQWGQEMLLRQIEPGRQPTKAKDGPPPTLVPVYRTTDQTRTGNQTKTGGSADSRGQTGYNTEERRGIDGLIERQEKP
jgi:membrane protein required for colicin V production